MRILAIFILLINTAFAQNPRMMFHMMNGSTTATPKDSIKVQCYLTSTAQSGWVHLQGDPGAGNISATGGNSNTISVTAVSANWVLFGGTGTCAFANNGTPSATFFPTNVVNECWFSDNSGDGDFYNSAKHKFLVTGLNPSKTYTVVMGGTLAPAFDANTDYNIVGIIRYGPIAVQGFNNLSNVATFSSVTPDGSGQLKLYVNGHAGVTLSVISGFTIKEN